MTGRTIRAIAVVLLAGTVLGACNRKREPNKIIDGFSAGSNEVVIPADAAQQFYLLKRDLMRLLMPVISKLPIDGALYPELSGAGPTYSFQTTERRYGAMTWTVEFKSDANATIDPVADDTATAALKSIVVTGSGASNEFPAITEGLTLVFESSGVVTSTLRMTGTTRFQGSSYDLTFTFDPNGSKAIFEALTDGYATAAGSGGTPSTPATVNLAFGSDHNANGSLTWEGRDGGLHFSSDGSGFVVEPGGRIFLD